MSKKEMQDEKTNKKPKVENFELANSDETLHLANDVAKFIKENKLYQNIQGKEYVNVEAWQYAGSRLGITPIVEHLINISDENELKYQAKVNLWDLRQNQLVGSGFAICSSKEQGKRYYQEYAIASMAQTRAIGKAFRNMLAWIIRAAGYEPTPAEEMDYNTNMADAAQKPVKPVTEKKQMKAVPAVEEQEPETTTIRYATAKQKEEIIRLLNNPVITRQEKTKMLLNINKLDEERATQAIDKLKKAIEEREEQRSAA